MALYSFDAIEIFTDDGYGLRTGYDNAALGFSSGVFRARTGRFTISTVAGDTEETLWYTGILTDDSITCSRSCDPTVGGVISDSSSLDFSVVNVEAFWKTLDDVPLHLRRCKVCYYYATSTNGTDWTFYKRWTGVVDSQPYNELTLKIQCVDNRKDVLSSIPKIGVDKNRFANAPSDSLDKIIPLVYGRVAKSPLVNVNESGAKVNLCFIDGVYYQAAGCTLLAHPTQDTQIGNVLVYESDWGMVLETTGVSFNVNDARVIGKYLTIILGGVEQSRIIKANEETSQISSTVLRTVFYFSDQMDTTQAFVPWSSGSTSDAVWYAQIGDYTSLLLSSADTVSEHIENINGNANLYQFDENAKRYMDISSIQSESNTTVIGNAGLPGVRVASAANLDSGSIDIYRPIVPNSVVLVSMTNISNGVVSVGDAIPVLIDGDRDSYSTFTRSQTVTSTLILDAYFENFEKFAAFDELYILPDFTESCTVSHTRDIDMALSVYDFYGRTINTGLSENLVTDTLSSGITRSEYFLPNDYYGDTKDSENGFYSKKSSFDLSDTISNHKAGITYRRVRLTFTFHSSGIAGTYTFNLSQIGLVAKSTLRYTTEQVYADVIGSKFGSTWNARKTASDPCLLIGDILEKAIRDHDYGYKPWRESADYAYGDIVKTVADNKHYYIAIVAGLSGASEPTWPTISGGTIVDNEITWVEIGTYAIDEDAFDTLNYSTRSSAFAGRTLVEKESTEDIIRDIASQFFLGIRTTKGGEISPIAFLEYSESAADFDETNSWDTSEVEETQPGKVYNEFKINYAYDYATQTYNRQFFITNIDRPVFPGIDEVSSELTNLGTFTIRRRNTPGGGITVRVVTDTPHGRKTGDLVTLIGNTEGYSFDPSEISVDSTTSFNVKRLVASAASSTTGELYYINSKGLKWKEYVGGVESYPTAKTLWERCNLSFQKIKEIKKYPENLSGCKWIIDPLAQDANGTPLWTGLDSENLNPAYRLLMDLSRWTAWQKKVISRSIDKTPTNLALNVFDYVTIADEKNTAGESLGAYITNITDVPRSGNKKEHLRVTMMCYPTFSEGPPIRVIDVADSSNRIIDTPDETTRLVDTPQ